ncbi:MAG: pancreas/duodenum homeobox protein 1 [Desulfobulbaceae bacterium]|nr:MAG: pancreas/duodenum homeobox protein 1 [Desulfobulbaceae bacterium]
MSDKYQELFTEADCSNIFPASRSNEFFEALFGDADEGSYDIELAYAGSTPDTLQFELLLHERPGHCLACNLTQGLPQVFNRHPIIDVSGIVEKVNKMIGDQVNTGEWSLGYTQQKSSSLHAIPLTIMLVEAG